MVPGQPGLGGGGDEQELTPKPLSRRYEGHHMNLPRIWKTVAEDFNSVVQSEGATLRHPCWPDTMSYGKCSVEYGSGACEPWFRTSHVIPMARRIT